MFYNIRDRCLMLKVVSMMTSIEMYINNYTSNGTVNKQPLSIICPICGYVNNYFYEYSYNGFMWSSLYKHYIMNHNAIPSQKFIKMVLGLKEIEMQTFIDYINNMISYLKMPESLKDKNICNQI